MNIRITDNYTGETFEGDYLEALEAYLGNGFTRGIPVLEQALDGLEEALRSGTTTYAYEDFLNITIEKELT